MDVVKVYQDVAYVAMVVHVCCKGLLPMFHLCFPDVCRKCVYLELHMFYLDVMYICNGFQVFSGVF